MNEPTSPRFDNLDPDLARRIDAICRRFEADWRAGKRPPIDDYLADVSEEGRPALRAELEALERELRQSEETGARSEAPPPSAFAETPDHRLARLRPGRRRAPPVSTRTPTSPPRDDAIRRPRPIRRIDARHQGLRMRPKTHQPDPGICIRYFGDYEIVRELARGGMGGTSSRPSRSASTGP